MGSDVDRKYANANRMEKTQEESGVGGGFVPMSEGGGGERKKRHGFYDWDRVTVLGFEQINREMLRRSQRGVIGVGGETGGEGHGLGMQGACEHSSWFLEMLGLVMVAKWQGPP